MKQQGFPREVRLRRRAEFRRVYEHGVKEVRGPLVLFAATGEASATRLGVTATRKVGNAVVRNRGKRKVREAFRRVRDQLPAGLDLVVVVRRALLGSPPEQIEQAVVEAAARARDRLR